MNEEQKSCDIFKFPFERNNYYYGKLMTQREYFAEQSYFNKKRWLINRLVNGWGVVCGLEVKSVLKDSNDPSQGYELRVTPGIAIDCCGREITVYEEQVVDLDPDINPGVICLEHFECETEPVHIPFIECEQKDKFEFNRIRDSFQIVIKDPGEVNMERPSGENCPLLEDQLASLDGYVCEKLMAGCPECSEQPCLVLAEITIENNSREIIIDECSKRRLVYNNSLLYDLIHCFHGDFPHVVRTNWRHGKPHEYTDLEIEEISESMPINPFGLNITFDKQMDSETLNTETLLLFVKLEYGERGNYRYEQIPGDISCIDEEYLFCWNDIPGTENEDRLLEYLRENHFINWANKDYVDIIKTEDNRIIFIIRKNDRSDKIMIYRKEDKAILKIDSGKNHELIVKGEDGKQNIYDQNTIAIFQPKKEWIADVYLGYSKFRDDGKFMVVLKSDFIMSKDGLGKALDGNFIGGKLPSGNGTQGGDFISWFSLRPPSLDSPLLHSSQIQQTEEKKV
ncbi:hypothetical protein C5S42_12435 [Candidatus Methanomarinus sp.]|nr:hypothetical protein C5S42_12435 [ANME-2 cluster archaeon]